MISFAWNFRNYLSTTISIFIMFYCQVVETFSSFMNEHSSDSSYIFFVSWKHTPRATNDVISWIRLSEFSGLHVTLWRFSVDCLWTELYLCGTEQRDCVGLRGGKLWSTGSGEFRWPSFTDRNFVNTRYVHDCLVNNVYKM